ncbi:hypothetical protein [Ferruginibacter sp. SUN106]|uniref:hypothetical protein n=1 Tax=Ferruginibacter sp. SUN106 TaxID=2978348 RepID=UPI003D366133
MIKTQILITISFFYLQNVTSQKLFIVPGLVGQYSYFSKATPKESDFSTKPKFNGTWFIDVCYMPSKTLFKISLKESVLGENFNIKTNFSDTSLGFRKIEHSDGIDQLVLTFQVQKDIFANTNKSDYYLNWFYTFGAGIGFNRAKYYYDSFLIAKTIRWDGMYNYAQHTTSFVRKGLGLFLSSAIGFKWINGKGKTILISELYADLGLTRMLRVNVNYEYGTYSNPSLHRKVDDMELNSTGTTFGLKIGVPIKVLKKERHKKRA